MDEFRKAESELERKERREFYQRLALVALGLIALSFVIGLYAGATRPRAFTCRYIMGGGGLIRVQIIESGDSGLDDLLAVMPSAEFVLKMSDPRAALLLPGDIFTARCVIVAGGGVLDFVRCEIVPAVQRGK